MDINFFTCPRPSSSGLGVIKTKEEKREMEGWMRYNVVAMLSHWKLEKITRKIRQTMQKSILYLMTMECNIPRDCLNYQSIWINTSLQSPLYLMIPLTRKNNSWIFFNYKKIVEKSPGYLWEIYWHAVRVHTNESSFHDTTDAMM